METFVVEIERTEKYRTKVLVKAVDKADARRRAMEFDADNGLENTWNELQPEVETAYSPYNMGEAHPKDGEEGRLPVVE